MSWTETARRRHDRRGLRYASDCIRLEWQMMERLDFDLSFRWFVGLGVDDRAWDASTFSKNRELLLDGEIAARLLLSILALPRVRRLWLSDHFSVDGTLIDA